MRNNFIRIFESMKISNLNFGTSGFVKSTYTVAKSLVDSEIHLFLLVQMNTTEFAGSTRKKWMLRFGMRLLPTA
ncbi:MAG: hypothetical protein L6V90_11615 [Treponema succinifaciens]|nr:MAG: hypothetical protein L6V90_11615 [Treponema succinifaciens]